MVVLGFDCYFYIKVLSEAATLTLERWEVNIDQFNDKLGALTVVSK